VLNHECTDSGFLNAHRSVGLHQPFYLAYQERNNRDLMKDYAQICHKVIHHWEITQLKVAPGLSHHNDSIKTGQKQRFKLGIISDQIRYHSVWNAITKGIVQHLNLDRFEIHIFYLGTITDEQTAFAKSRAASFTQNLPSLKDWAQTVLSKELDAVLYPEIGMHALTLQLAHLRLAPLQMVSWGHPETTGIQTIDYYLSAQLFEDSESQNAYSEKLLALPSLGCTYEELQVRAEYTDLSAYGLRPQSIKLLCPGTLFKYSPDYDWTFAEIAQELLNTKYSQNVLPGDNTLTEHSYQFLFLYREFSSCELFKARLKTAFQAKGLNLDDWVVFLPWMSPHSFYGLMKNADLFLDSLGFSGFNTAMQAVECALPIVTMHGRFLRGRFASGILSKLGIKECIAHSAKEYVQKVVEFANDPTLHARIKAKMSANRQTLFNDLEPVRALEQFLLNRMNPPL
jgi:predicted O-linked N-acetylglucosamine transferase (SPINDLY family)